MCRDLKLWRIGLTLLVSLVPAVSQGRGEAASHVQAAGELAGRILHKRAGEFTFKIIPTDKGRDVFEISSGGGKVVIGGNNGVSMAVGLNWYLNQYCYCHVSLGGRQLNLPDTLPAVKSGVKRVSPYRYRYFLNYCCFGYSLPWWDWSRWEELIDWMALNGVNMPLSVTGQEAVWQGVGRKLGLTDKQIEAFLAGPPYLPFGWMGCLDGWGGPLTQKWIDAHEALQKKILARQRGFGMTPVLQGFTGHVPAAIKDKFPQAKLHQIRWLEWRTNLLDPLDPLYARIAKIYMEEQGKRFGTDHLYAADTFIEMTPPSGDVKFLNSLSRAILDGMAKTDPKAVWVLQGWTFMNQKRFWTQKRIEAFLGAVPDDRMVVLDLFCERTPMWSRTKAFCGKPWVWCNIQNFGNVTFLGGGLDRIAQNSHAARSDPNSGRMVGLGFVNEGLGQNPVVYDLMFASAWGDGPVDVKKYLRDYARSRYGKSDPNTEAAWRALHETVYARTLRGRSPVDRVPTLRPMGSAPYSNTRLAAAWRGLLEVGDKFGQADTYRYDLVNVARQVLSNHAAELHRDVIEAYRAKDSKTFAAAGERFLQLIDDIDGLLATRKEFLLGRWLNDAKRWGDNDAERAKYEWNARRVLTLWGTGKVIRDYARKEWSGMLGGFYRKRWAMYFKALGDALDADKPFDAKAFGTRLLKWEADWASASETYPHHPRGRSLEVARRLWNKYAQAFKPVKPVKPDAISLTTGKPVTCSSALALYPARLANDGRARSTDFYWATDVAGGKEAWWRVDLVKPTTVSRVVVIGYYGDKRFYGFTVETSLDGKKWRMAADHRENKALSTARGYTCKFPAREVRYIRVTQTHNSANTGRHLVEVMAFEK